MKQDYNIYKNPKAFLPLLVPFITISVYLIIVLDLPILRTQDDAFITFRYARNLVRGHGPVYNPGVPVEGYTNFLWMIVMAGVLKLKGDPIFFSRLFGIVSGVGLIWFCWLGGARILKHKIALTIVAPAILVVFPGFAAESVEGLETIFFSFLLLGGIVLTAWGYEQRSVVAWHPLLFALASMTRPEGVMVFVLTMMCVFVHGWLNQSIRLRFILRSSLIYLVIFLPYYLWRYQYYGYPFPNTYYAKTGGGMLQAQRGLEYVISFIGEFSWVLLLLSLMIVLPLLKRYLLLHICTVVTLGYLAYVALIGGDFKPTYRFLIPVTALVCLIYQAALAELCAFIGRRRSGVPVWCLFAATMLSIFVCLKVYSGSEQLRRKYSRLENGVSKRDYIDRARVIGNWIHMNSKPGDHLAISTAGAIAYFSDIPVIDMLGLNDLHIARSKPIDFGSGLAGHECADSDYVLSLKPRFIIFKTKIIKSPITPKTIRTTLIGEKQLSASTEFKANYEAKTFPVFDEYGVVYVRKY